MTIIRPLRFDLIYATGAFICARNALRRGEGYFEARRHVIAVGEDDLLADLQPLYRDFKAKEDAGDYEGARKAIGVLADRLEQLGRPPQGAVLA